MLGLIIAGRMLQTDMQVVEPGKFVFNIENAAAVNHVVIFMTGQEAFPDGMGGAVYYCQPSDNGPSFHLLGHISNQKQSAIFKLTNLKQMTSNATMTFGTSQGQAQIGISVEPLDQLVQQTASVSEPSSATKFDAFTRAMLENFVNFASSFAITQQQMVPEPSKSFVPLNVLEKWYQNFQRRLQQNPRFWEK